MPRRPRRLQVPLVTTRQEEEAVYRALRQVAAQRLAPAPLAARRIAAACIIEGGAVGWFTVGEPHDDLGELVMGIFQADADDGPVLVLTPSRGVWRGQPVEIPGGQVIEVREFR